MAFKRSGVRSSSAPPKHNSAMSEEVQKPARNSGFFVVFRPEMCYEILQNPASLGADLQ